MAKKIKKLPKYAAGVPYAEIGNAVGGLGQVIGATGEDASSDASYAGAVLSSAGSMAATGAAFGPWGAAAGAAVGAAIGVVGAEKAKKDALMAKKKLGINKSLAQNADANAQAQAQYAINNPENNRVPGFKKGTGAFKSNDIRPSYPNSMLSPGEVVRDGVTGQMQQVPGPNGAGDVIPANMSEGSSVYPQKPIPGGNETSADIATKLAIQQKMNNKILNPKHGKKPSRIDENTVKINEMNIKKQSDLLNMKTQMDNDMAASQSKTKLPGFKNGIEGFVETVIRSKKDKNSYISNPYQYNQLSPEQQAEFDVIETMVGPDGVIRSSDPSTNGKKWTKNSLGFTKNLSDFSNENRQALQNSGPVQISGINTGNKATIQAKAPSIFNVDGTLKQPGFSENNGILPDVVNNSNLSPSNGISSQSIQTAVSQVDNASNGLKTSERTTVQPIATKSFVPNAINSSLMPNDGNITPSFVDNDEDRWNEKISKIQQPGFSLSASKGIDNVKPIMEALKSDIPENTIPKKSPGINLGKALSSVGTDLASLAPVAYNLTHTTPEIDTPVYESYINPNQRYNIAPQVAESSKQRTIARYNAANINTGTGANLATAGDIYSRGIEQLSNIMDKGEVANNTFRSQYADRFNAMSAARANETRRVKDINARNKAAAENNKQTGLSQLSQYAQNKQLMGNMKENDNLNASVWSEYSKYLDDKTKDRLLKSLTNR